MTSRKDQLYSTDTFDDRPIETLDNGFERLGPHNSPFTLQAAPTGPLPEIQRRAESIYAERPLKQRRQEELRNEPITLDVEKWKNNIGEFDFPGVDTIPPALRQQRADAAAEIASSLYGIGPIQRGVDFADPDVRGRYWRGDGLIEIGTNEGDFPGWSAGVTLAHEVAHGIDEKINVEIGYASSRGGVFETERQREEASELSERLRGPIVETDIPGAKNYRKHPTEKAADVIAAMIIEPERAREIAPAVTSRVDDYFEDFFEQFLERSNELDEAWIETDS